MQQREDERAESYRQGLRQGSVLRAAFLLSGFPPRLYFTSITGGQLVDNRRALLGVLAPG